MAIIDGYSETNIDDYYAIYGPNSTGRGQSFTGDGTLATSCKFYLCKGGSPTGNAVVKLYAHSGTFGTTSLPTGSALATASPFNVATLDDYPNGQFITFTFITPYQTVNGTKYVITIEYSGNGSNALLIAMDDTSPTHAGNDCEIYDGTNWWYNGNCDDIFYVNSTPTYTVTSKARIKQLGVTKTSTTKASIKILGNTKTETSKARIKIKDITNTCTTKARIKQIGLTKTVTSKARIETVAVTKTTTAKAWIKVYGISKTISAKAYLIGLFVVQTVQTKANILNTATLTVTGKARIVPEIQVISLDGIFFPPPSESRISPVFPKSTETLGGKTRTDVTKRKYQYDVRWRFLPSVDYNNLENVVNSLADVTFTYERYPQSQNGVLVKAALGDRSHTAMAGDDFYSDISIKLTEVSSRI